MAPARNSGQLDQISEAIGRLEGKFEGLDRYTHEREHNIANLSQKVDGIGTLITREVAKLEERMKVRFEAVENRVTILELSNARETGAKNVVVWFLQSPIVGWIAAAALFFAGWWKSAR